MPDTELEPAIAALLKFCWQPFNSEDPHLLEQTATWLAQAGYSVRFTER